MTHRPSSAVKLVRSAMMRVELTLPQAIGADAVAVSLGCSKWTLLRAFRAVSGSPFAAYVRRRRLAWAAEQLAGTSRRVVEIALDAGFASHEAFTRAFRRVFRMPPRQFRRASARLDPPAIGRLVRGDHQREEQRMGQFPPPAIIERPPVVLWGTAARFIPLHQPQPNNMAVITALWDRFFAAFPGLRDVDTYGAISPVEDDDVSEEYFAGVVWEKGRPPPGGETRKVPGGVYACFRHTGPITDIEDTVALIYGQWLPHSGFQLRPGPEIERFPAGYDAFSPSAVMEILVPVARLPE